MLGFVRIGSLIAMSLLLAACGGKSGVTQDDDLFGEYGGGQGSSGGASSSGVDGAGFGAGGEFGESAGMGGPETGPAASEQNRLVYFDYDQADVPEKYRAMLIAHGGYLSANPAARVRLEGHADERGSREYNIGLAERRAQAVRQFLLLQGVTADQLNTVSYGEERPAVLGGDEESWSLNRRVELVYLR